ncbi:hypothetical protein R3P38DRAFT_2637148 [Favolaschia claudopus]|uniref:Uncharacterized protein n=1 Tax=Favolaschia claudopus TaxID=2862362 RepID=A0AAW0ASN6_9AGAR
MNCVAWSKTLKTGLLNAVFLCGGKYGTDPYIGTSLNRILADLAVLTFSYFFLPTLMSVLPSVATLLPSTGFMQSGFGKDWRGIVALAQERLELRKIFDSALVGVRSCDNSEVRGAGLPSFRRRETLIHISFFISVCAKCQKHSWSKYKHHIVSDARENRFRFMLILNTYRTNKPIFLQKLEYIHQTRNTDYCVVMEYVAGYCTPTIAPIEERERSIRSHEYDNGQRVAVGMREIHMVRLAPGMHCQCMPQKPKLLQLRSNKAEVLQGLVGIAGRLRKDADVGRLKDDFPEMWREYGGMAVILGHNYFAPSFVKIRTGRVQISTKIHSYRGCSKNTHLFVQKKRTQPHVLQKPTQAVVGVQNRASQSADGSHGSNENPPASQIRSPNTLSAPSEHYQVRFRP